MLERWLTYDQISLIPTHVSTLEHRAEADTSVQFGPAKLRVPIIAAPMPDVCDYKMAWTLWDLGAMGIINRFQPGLHEPAKLRSDLNLQTGIAISPRLNDATLWSVHYRYESLYESGYRIFCLDTANGASEMVHRALGTLKDKYPDIFIITGNVASAENFRKLEEWGADAIRVGIAGGSVCETRTETGVYSPMASVLIDVLHHRAKLVNPRRPETWKHALVIADGGIRTPADMCKALVLGADVVMLGGALAGTAESPGEVLKVDGKKYKILRGAASFSTQKSSKGEQPDYVEGAETLIPYRGPVEKVIHRFAAGLRSSMSYMNARDLTTYRRNVKIVEV